MYVFDDGKFLQIIGSNTDLKGNIEPERQSIKAIVLSFSFCGLQDKETEQDGYKVQLYCL